MRIRGRGLALALIVAACTNGPVPTPTGVPPAVPPPTAIVEPTASAAASPVATPSSPGPGTFDLTLGGAAGPPLPVHVVDRTGLVVSVEDAGTLSPVGSGAGPGLLEGLANPDGDETTLVYGWVGGACDRSTMVEFERTDTGYRLDVTTVADPGPCILIGILRGLELHLSEPVPASDVMAVLDRS